jgi:hypothetical protein
VFDAVQQDYLQPRKGLDEVDNCRRRMARFYAERKDQVSEVLVKADDREMKRRTNEEALRVDRRHKHTFSKVFSTGQTLHSNFESLGQ